MDFIYFGKEEIFIYTSKLFVCIWPDKNAGWKNYYFKSFVFHLKSF